MDNFEQVTTDIINAISNIKYDDKEKRLLQTEIMLNLFNLFRNKTSYEQGIDTLRKTELSNKKLNLNYRFNKEQ